MQDAGLFCPRCRQPMDGRKCTNTNCDITDVDHVPRQASDTDPAAVLAGLAGTGRVLFDLSSESLIIRGAPNMPVTPVSVNTPDSGAFATVAHFVATVLGYSPDQYKPDKARSLLSYIHQNGPDPLPTVTETGDYPCLMHDQKDDSLYFPVISTDLSRLMGSSLYTGVPLTPQDHGGLFEQWLSSFRCATPEDKEVLRAWCVGALLQRLIPSGGFPGLLIAAHTNGAGKTATAEMLSAILGQCLNVYWPSIRDEESFMRKVLGGRRRFVLVDNMTPEGNECVIDASSLAAMMTRGEFVVKKLYVSTGSISCANRYLYILTANQPMLSPELLSRVVILSLDKGAGFSLNWISSWTARRTQLLEDMMFYCISRWAQGPLDISDRAFRFPEWWGTVTRVLRVRPTLRSARPAVESCYSWAVLRQLNHLPPGQGRSLALLCREFSSIKSGPLKKILQQQRVTPDLLLAELAWSEDIEIYDQGSEKWARVKSG